MFAFLVIFPLSILAVLSCLLFLFFCVSQTVRFPRQTCKINIYSSFKIFYNSHSFTIATGMWFKLIIKNLVKKIRLAWFNLINRPQENKKKFMKLLVIKKSGKVKKINSYNLLNFIHKEKPNFSYCVLPCCCCC